MEHKLEIRKMREAKENKIKEARGKLATNYFP